MRRIGVVALALTLFTSGVAHAASVLPYSNLFVFGDSLVDAGNAQIVAPQFGIADPAPAADGYYMGRFSNGPTFADNLSQTLTGQLTAPSFAGGSNFGVGGALTALVPGENPFSFPTQLQSFQASGQTISSDSLVLVTFGGNDVRFVLPQTGMVDFTPAVNALTGGLNTLVGAGARNIVVTGLPDIGQLPRTFQQTGGDPLLIMLASERSALLNDQFSVATQMVQQQTGANVQFFDLLGFQMDVLADPGAFGLPALNTTTPCLAVPGALATGCSGFLYFDLIHPTDQVHAAIARGIEAQLAAAVPEPSTWAMMVIGFGAAGAAIRRRRRPASAQVRVAA